MKDSEFVKIAKALADPTRRHLISCLREQGQMTCSQVCETFPLSQPTISHHIKTLEASGIISIRKDGQFHILTLDEPRLAAFASLVAGKQGDPNPTETLADVAPPRKVRKSTC